MYKFKTMNHISPYGLQKLEERGCGVGEDIQAPDGLILRSADLHSYAFEPSLITIARSGADTISMAMDEIGDGDISYDEARYEKALGHKVAEA